jgi:hypothetical protein
MLLALANATLCGLPLGNYDIEAEVRRKGLVRVGETMRVFFGPNARIPPHDTVESLWWSLWDFEEQVPGHMYHGQFRGIGIGARRGIFGYTVLILLSDSHRIWRRLGFAVGRLQEGGAGRCLPGWALAGRAADGAGSRCSRRSRRFS